jgi:hypothetical protein
MHNTQSVFIIKPGISMMANDMLASRTVVGELLLLKALHAAASILANEAWVFFTGSFFPR